MTMNTRNMLNRFVTGMIVVVALVWCGTAQAQTNFYWTNTASSLWSTHANWTNGYPSQNGGTNVILNFNVAGTYTSSNDWTTGVFTNNRLVFGAGTVILDGGTNALINNGAVMPVVTNYSGNIATINNPLILATNTTFAGANNITVNGNVGGSGGMTKTSAGALTLSGSNTYSGTTTVNGGSLKVGSSTAIPTSSVLAVTSGTFDLNGNSVVVSNLTTSSVNTGTITDTGTGSGTGTLTVAYITQFKFCNLLTDGGSRKLALVLMGNGSLSNTGFTNNNNTFSGGITLTSSGGNGCRTEVQNARYTGSPGAITAGDWGCGPITIGTSATDKAQLFLTGNNVTLPNDIIVNTSQGSDRGGAFRVNSQAPSVTLAGTITANLAPILFYAEGTTANISVSMTGKITGGNGLVVNVITNEIILSNSLGNNDYLGNTTNTAGTLKLGADNQIPNGNGKGNVYLAGTGILDLNGHSDMINGLSGAGVVSNSSAVAAVLTVGDNDQTSTFSGTINSTAGTLTLAKIGAGTLTLSGSNTGNGAVTVNGGILISSGVNTYNGATWVNAGRFVEVTGSSCSNSALNLADGATNSVSAVLGGAWSCASLTCTGGTTTLDFDFGSFPDTMAPLNVIGGLYVTGTVNVVVRNGDWPATGTYPLVKYGVNGVGPGSFALTLPSGVSATLNNNTGSKQLELNVTTVPLYTSQPTSVWTNKSNGNWSTPTCWSNSIPDGTNVVADFSKANVGAQLRVIVDSARTIGTLVYNNTTANNLLVDTSPVTLATTSGVPAIIVSNQTVTINSVLQGTQGFIKNGAGGLTLGGANTYSGPTIIKAGTLTIGGTYANNSYYLGDTSGGLAAALTLSVNSTLGNIIVQGGGSGVSAINSGGCNLTAPITLGSSGQAHDLAINQTLGSGTMNVYATIVDPSGLSGSGGTVTLSAGSGFLKLWNASTFSGETRFKDGQITFANQNALSNSTLNLIDSATLGYTVGQAVTLGGLKGTANLASGNYTFTIGNNNKDTSYSGVLSGTTPLTKIGAGTLTLGGANTYSGGTTNNSGFIGVSNNLAMSTGLVTLSGGGIVGAAGTWAITNVINLSSSAKFDTTGSLELMGPVTNSGALRKIGAGTLTLSGTNTYTGGTTVSNGTLIVNGSVTGAVTVVAGSTLGGTGVVAGVVTNNGTITAGDITTNGTLTVTNLVMAENATYVWNSDAAATSGDVIQVNGTLTLPLVATVTVSRAGARIPSPGVLFTGFTNNLSSADLSKWVINGAPASTRVKVSGSQVILVVPNGWVISLQ